MKTWERSMCAAILPYTRVTYAQFAIHACHVMIILPYMRIAFYRYVTPTEDGRAQRSPGSISMGTLNISLLGFTTQVELIKGSGHYW